MPASPRSISSIFAISVTAPGLFLLAALAARAFAGETAGDQSEEAYRRYKTAVELHFQGNLEAAALEYRNAITLDPGVAAYHADLGEAYRLMGNSRGAIEELKTAIRLAPDMADAYTTLGVVYDSENLPVKAIQCHRQAIDIRPDHFVAMNNLGQVYEKLGLQKAAVAVYKQALEFNPVFPPTLDNLGTSYLKAGLVDEGIALIEKAIENSDALDPRLGLYYNDLGAAFVMKERYREARKHFEKAGELLPGQPDIMRNLKYVSELIERMGGESSGGE
ncbi:MAG: tetratricopeptide repeat protein [bacterium]